MDVAAWSFTLELKIGAPDSGRKKKTANPKGIFLLGLLSSPSPGDLNTKTARPALLLLFLQQQQHLRSFYQATEASQLQLLTSNRHPCTLCDRGTGAGHRYPGKWYTSKHLSLRN